MSILPKSVLSLFSCMDQKAARLDFICNSVVCILGGVEISIFC